MGDKFWSEIICDLKLLLETKSNQDVCIQVGKESDYTEFYAHSLILSCRSQYFHNIFSTNSIERKDGMYIMKKPSITSISCRNILRWTHPPVFGKFSFIYIGKVDLDPENGVETLSLLIASNEFGLHKLSQYVTDFLIQHQRNFIRKDPIHIIDIVYSHDLFINLREVCLDVICSDPEILLATDNTKSSTESFLFSFSDYNNPKTGIIGRVKSHGCSVHCYKDWGPIFGNFEGGNDLAMKRKAEWKSKPVSYPNVNIPKKFICSEYEPNESGKLLYCFEGIKFYVREYEEFQARTVKSWNLSKERFPNGTTRFDITVYQDTFYIQLPPIMIQDMNLEDQATLKNRDDIMKFKVSAISRLIRELVKIIQNLPAYKKNHNARIYLFFIVPDDIYDTFRYQRYITPKKNIGNDWDTFQEIRRKFPFSIM
ncbi:10697_t:CDS:2 [Funneliformis geosporum]|nr:10697_t:CDS:2 [Funneliformis geosporum]